MLLALGLAATMGGVAYWLARARNANEKAAIAVARDFRVGAYSLEGAMAWNEGRSPSDAQVTWEALGTTDDELVVISAKTPANEYVYDVDVEGGHVHPANPKAMDLFAEVKKQE